MRIECPNCGTAYKVDETDIPAEGREVECAKCHNLWFQVPVPVLQLRSEAQILASEIEPPNFVSRQQAQPSFDRRGYPPPERRDYADNHRAPQPSLYEAPEPYLGDRAQQRERVEYRERVDQHERHAPPSETLPNNVAQILREEADFTSRQNISYNQEFNHEDDTALLRRSITTQDAPPPHHAPPQMPPPQAPAYQEPVQQEPELRRQSLLSEGDMARFSETPAQQPPPQEPELRRQSLLSEDDVARLSEPPAQQPPAQQPPPQEPQEEPSLEEETAFLKRQIDGVGLEQSPPMSAPSPQEDESFDDANALVQNSEQAAVEPSRFASPPKKGFKKPAGGFKRPASKPAAPPPSEAPQPPRAASVPPREARGAEPSQPAQRGMRRMGLMTSSLSPSTGEESNDAAQSAAPSAEQPLTPPSPAKPSKFNKPSRSRKKEDTAADLATFEEDTPSLKKSKDKKKQPKEKKKKRFIFRLINFILLNSMAVTMAYVMSDMIILIYPPAAPYLEIMITQIETYIPTDQIKEFIDFLIESAK